MLMVSEGGPLPTVAILQSDWSCRFTGGGTNLGIGLTPDIPFFAEGGPRPTSHA